MVGLHGDAALQLLSDAFALRCVANRRQVRTAREKNVSVNMIPQPKRGND